MHVEAVDHHVSHILAQDRPRSTACCGIKPLAYFHTPKFVPIPLEQSFKDRSIETEKLPPSKIGVVVLELDDSETVVFSAEKHSVGLTPANPAVSCPIAYPLRRHKISAKPSCKSLARAVFIPNALQAFTTAFCGPEELWRVGTEFSPVTVGDRCELK